MSNKPRKEESSTEIVNQLSPNRRTSHTAITVPIEEKRAVFRVGGMTCASCVNTIETCLTEKPGVLSCRISLLSERAEIDFDSSRVNEHVLKEWIEDMGFDADEMTDEMKAGTLELLVDGMTCSSCVGAIENGLRQRPGVKSATVSLLTKRARIEYDHTLTGVRSIIEAIEDLGFDASTLDQPSSQQLEALTRSKEINEWRSAFLYSLWFTIPEFFLGHIIPAVPLFRRLLYVPVIFEGLFLISIIEILLTIPVQFGIGWRFYVSAYKALKHDSATMDVLIAVSTTCSFSFSVFAILYGIAYPNAFMNAPPMTFFDTSTMLITFVVLGKYLENLAKGRTSNALARLYSLKPADANLVEETSDGTVERKISIEMLQMNDIVKVLPGEKIPSDGIVVKGGGLIDESFVTGEAMPVEKQVGDLVIGGTLNSGGGVNKNHDQGDSVGVFYVKITRVGQDSALSQIIKMVEEAQTSKPPIQNIADKVSAYFVPAVISLSILTFAVWFVILSNLDVETSRIASVLIASSSMADSMMPMENGWNGRIPTFLAWFLALKIAISVVVVACPCALGLATPTAVMVGTGVGAQLGIFIKNGKVFELANKVKRIVFDKTGTLTEGKVSVVSHKILSILGSDLDPLFYALIGISETNSEHPLAKAVVEKAKQVLHSQSFDSVKLTKEVLRLLKPSVDADAVKASVKVLQFNAVAGSGISADIQLSFSHAMESHKLEFRVMVGNNDWLHSFNYTEQDLQSLRNHEVESFKKSAFSSGHTVIYTLIHVLNEPTSYIAKKPLLGVLSLADTLKPEAPLMIKVLTERFGMSVYMVTGDQWGSAKSIALKCGIPERNVFAGVSPGGKKRILESLQARTVDHFRNGVLNRTAEPSERDVSSPMNANWPQSLGFSSETGVASPNTSFYGSATDLLRRTWSYMPNPYRRIQEEPQKIAMVGDGINDSPALAQADVGISLCTGTDIAMEASDLVLVNRFSSTLSEKNSLLLLLTAVDLSRVIHRRIIFNFLWATLYNFIALPIAAGMFIPCGVLMHPVIAAVMMALSSISVVLSSLSLKNYKPIDWEVEYSEELIMPTPMRSWVPSFSWFRQSKKEFTQIPMAPSLDWRVAEDA